MSWSPSNMIGCLRRNDISAFLKGSDSFNQGFKTGLKKKREPVLRNLAELFERDVCKKCDYFFFYVYILFRGRVVLFHLGLLTQNSVDCYCPHTHTYCTHTLPLPFSCLHISGICSLLALRWDCRTVSCVFVVLFWTL